MTQCVGGDEYLYRLLNPLGNMPNNDILSCTNSLILSLITEMLVCVDEAQVRNTAVRSIEVVVSQMPVEHIAKHFVPFLERLSAKDGFTSRISASCLYHVVFNRMGELDKKHIKSLFYKLCQDDTPMVLTHSINYRINHTHLLTIRYVERQPKI